MKRISPSLVLVVLLGIVAPAPAQDLVEKIQVEQHRGTITSIQTQKNNCLLITVATAEGSEQFSVDPSTLKYRLTPRNLSLLPGSEEIAKDAFQKRKRLAELKTGQLDVLLAANHAGTVQEVERQGTGQRTVDQKVDQDRKQKIDQDSDRTTDQKVTGSKQQTKERLLGDTKTMTQQDTKAQTQTSGNSQTLTKTRSAVGILTRSQRAYLDEEEERRKRYGAPVKLTVGHKVIVVARKDKDDTLAVLVEGTGPKQPAQQDKEKTAKASFNLIMQLIADGKTENVKYRLERLIERFPGTKAAKEAQEQLDSMKP